MKVVAPIVLLAALLGSSVAFASETTAAREVSNIKVNHLGEIFIDTKYQWDAPSCNSVKSLVIRNEKAFTEYFLSLATKAISNQVLKLSATGSCQGEHFEVEFLSLRR